MGFVPCLLVYSIVKSTIPVIINENNSLYEFLFLMSFRLSSQSWKRSCKYVDVCFTLSLIPCGFLIKMHEQLRWTLGHQFFAWTTSTNFYFTSNTWWGECSWQGSIERIRRHWWPLLVTRHALRRKCRWDSAVPRKRTDWPRCGSFDSPECVTWFERTLLARGAKEQKNDSSVDKQRYHICAMNSDEQWQIILRIFPFPGVFRKLANKTFLNIEFVWVYGDSTVYQFYYRIVSICGFNL